MSKTNNKDTDTIVIKVGTSSLLNVETGVIALSRVAALVEVIAALRRKGNNVVLVSSGAVGFGRLSLSSTKKNYTSSPVTVAQKQALAAIGQAKLMRHYDEFFSAVGCTISQVLLTYENLGDRSQHQNASNTFESLFEMGVIPIVNENDTVAVQELRFGDNDKLSAMVSSLVKAKWLFMLTDVNGVYTANPDTSVDAKLIPLVRDMSTLLVDTQMNQDGTSWGTGGMATKLIAAQLATTAGVRTVITNATKPSSILHIIKKFDTDGENDIENNYQGTVFLERTLRTKRGRKKWIAALPAQGKVYLDEGAVRAIKRKKSLFAVGVTRVSGTFPAQTGVDLCSDADGKAFARGIINYSNLECDLIKKLSTKEQGKVLGFIGPEELIHRDNLVLFVFENK
eukprot:g6509.t1